MSLTKIENVVIPVGDENGLLKYVVGIKLGDRDPAIVCNQGQPLVFESHEDAQLYIDEEL